MSYLDYIVLDQIKAAFKGSPEVLKRGLKIHLPPNLCEEIAYFQSMERACEDPRYYKCFICDELFTSDGTMELHLVRKHKLANPLLKQGE